MHSSCVWDVEVNISIVLGLSCIYRRISTHQNKSWQELLSGTLSENTCMGGTWLFRGLHTRKHAVSKTDLIKCTVTEHISSLGIKPFITRVTLTAWPPCCLWQTHNPAVFTLSHSTWTSLRDDIVCTEALIWSLTPHRSHHTQQWAPTWEAGCSRSNTNTTSSQESLY